MTGWWRNTSLEIQARACLGSLTHIAMWDTMEGVGRVAMGVFVNVTRTHRPFLALVVHCDM